MKNNLFQTPLMLCVENGDLKMLKFLLKKKIDLNKRDIKGNSELFYSLKSKNLKKVIYLFKNGSNINHKNLQDVT